MRSVFWLDERLIYDGVYSNVGWYGTLLIVYKVFGFGLFTAKKLRLLLHTAGLIAASALLLRALSPRQAVVPLLVAGLSPAMIYFDTLQTSYGVDVWYACICLALLCSIERDTPARTDRVKAVAAGAAAMIAAMSYPAFVFYLPSLVLVLAWRRLSRPVVALAAAGAAAPLLLAVAWVQNRALLWFDADTRAGLFRGGGALTTDAATVTSAIAATMRDVFVQGRSYYFDVAQPDFTGVLAAAALAVVAILAAYAAMREPATRRIVIAAGLLIVVSVVAPAFSSGEPGLRRSTGALAGFFVLFAVAWRRALSMSSARPWLRGAALAACALMPLASALKLPSLYRTALGDNAFQNRDWFVVAGPPEQSVRALSAQVAHGHAIACAVDANRRIIPCRYQEIYPAIAGYLRWNGEEHPVRALDWKTGREIVLTPRLWNDKYFPTCTRMDACKSP